jgi:hypothetical protein
MTTYRTPAQRLVLDWYRTERACGLHPLDAADQVRYRLALSWFTVAANHGRVLPLDAIEEMRAADWWKATVVAREHAGIGLVAS